MLSCEPQEWWEDGSRLQDPGRLSAPSCVGAKRRINKPQLLLTPVLYVMSRCHHGKPAECQRFRCLSSSNHVTTQKSEILRFQADGNEKTKQKSTGNIKKKKGRSNSFVLVFEIPHWLSEFDQLMQAPMKRQFDNTVVFLLVNKWWSWSKCCPLIYIHIYTHTLKSSHSWGFWKQFLIRKWHEIEDWKTIQTAVKWFLLCL